MNIIQRPASFQLDNHGLLDQQVRRIFTNGDALVPDSDPMLLLHREPCQTKFVRKGILIQFLKQSGPKLIASLERAPDDSLHRAVRPATLICVHLRFNFVRPNQQENLPKAPIPTTQS